MVLVCRITLRADGGEWAEITWTWTVCTSATCWHSSEPAHAGPHRNCSFLFIHRPRVWRDCRPSFSRSARLGGGGVTWLSRPTWQMETTAERKSHFQRHHRVTVDGVESRTHITAEVREVTRGSELMWTVASDDESRVLPLVDSRSLVFVRLMWLGSSWMCKCGQTFEQVWQSIYLYHGLLNLVNVRPVLSFQLALDSFYLSTLKYCM